MEFTATFEVLQSAAGKTEVSVLLPDEDNNILNYNGDPVDALIYSGFVNIEITVIFGDVDLNGTVEAADLVVLRAILLGNKTADAELLTVCDVNADGDIGIFDLIRLKRYLAGEDVLLGA